MLCHTNPHLLSTLTKVIVAVVNKYGKCSLKLACLYIVSALITLSSGRGATILLAQHSQFKTVLCNSHHTKSYKVSRKVL